MVANPSDNVTDLPVSRSRILGAIQSVRRYSTATGSARAVLNVLAGYATVETLEVTIGRVKLERDAGVSRSTARRAIRVLEELGELVTLEQGYGDKASRYRITLSGHVSPPVENPGEPAPYPNGERVHREPGEGSPRTRGRVHREPLSVVTGSTGEGVTFPDHCRRHATVPDPPPCRRCAETREARAANLEADRRREANDRRRRRLDQTRAAVDADKARATPPPDTFRAARRRVTHASHPGTVGTTPREDT